MKSTKSFLLSALCLLLGAPMYAMSQEETAMIDPNKPLKIVFDNDVHGSIERYEYLAGYRNSLIKAGFPVLTVSAGDYLQGSAYASLSQGAFCIDMINAVGYDVLAVGNHDVDYGIDHLLAMRDSLYNCSMICCNLCDANGKRCLSAYTIRSIGGYTVAFVGVLTTATEQLEANVVFDKEGNRRFSFSKDSLVKVVQQNIDLVRMTNPDWVVLLTHMGEEPLDDHMASWQLLEQLQGVDVVIDGHSHSVVNSKVLPHEQEQPVYVGQTGSALKNVGCVTLQRGEKPHIKLYATNTLPRSEAVHDVYQQVEDRMQPILGQVVGYTPFDLQYSINGVRAVRKQETNLGDLVADAYRTEMGTDIGWVNGGGVRRNIEMGDITYGQIVSVSPFNNFMCVAEITGQMLADALEECYHSCPVDLGSFAQISGIRCTVDTTIRNTLGWDEDNHLLMIGQRRVSNIEVYKDGQWRPVDMKEKLTIGSTNYVIFDGELQGLKEAKLIKDKVMTDTECLQKYIVNTMDGIIPDRYKKAQGRVNLK